MEVFLVILVLAVIGAIVRLAMGGDPATYPGRQLQEKFIGLGTLVGKNRSEIEAVVGPPNSISQIGTSKVLCQWMATGYHISLLFKADICERITHEQASN